MQIHDQDALDAHVLQHIGDYFGRNRHPCRAWPAILPRVAVVRHDSSDAPGGRALERIDHQHDLHQVIIGGRARRLQHEHVLTANVLVNLDHDLAVREPVHHRFTKWNTELSRDACCKFRGGRPGEHHQVLVDHDSRVM